MSQLFQLLRNTWRYSISTCRYYLDSYRQMRSLQQTRDELQRTRGSLRDDLFKMDMDDTNRQKHMKKELTNLTTELSNSNKKISEDLHSFATARSIAFAQVKGALPPNEKKALEDLTTEMRNMPKAEETPTRRKVDLSKKGQGRRKKTENDDVQNLQDL